MRGLEIKEDRPASIKIIQADGTELPLVDSGDPSGQTTTYTNFILQTVTEARMEKHQIVETFGESYVYFFGEAPRFLDVTAVIINSNDFNWEAEWWQNYEDNLRGTKTVERGARMYLFYDDNIVEGFMLNCQAVKSSDQPHLIQMGFRLFVTSYRNITFVGDPSYPIRASVVLPDSIDLRDPDSRFQLFSNSEGSIRDAALAQNADDANQVFSDNIDGFGQQTALTQLLRSAPRTASFPADVVASLEAIGGQDAIRAALGNLPIRGLIADNTDEIIGTPSDGGMLSFESNLPLAQAPIVRSFQEVENLWITAITALSCYGVDIDNNKALQDAGLMPRFSSGVNNLATFTPSSGFGFGTGVTDPRQLNAQQLSLPGNPTTSSTVTRDPLGAVFGSGTTQQINDRSTVQGGGDRAYGYDSDYGGPGFGIPGYGDFGGNGFGSGQGTDGDPGFKDPSSFTFTGVADQTAAFNQFNAPTANNTVFGASSASGASGRIGLAASTSGLSGSAATMIGGKPSAFSVSSLPGTLDSTGTAALLQVTGGSIAGAVSGASLVNPCSTPFDPDTVSGPSVGF